MVDATADAIEDITVNDSLQQSEHTDFTKQYDRSIAFRNQEDARFITAYPEVEEAVALLRYTEAAVETGLGPEIRAREPDAILNMIGGSVQNVLAIAPLEDSVPVIMRNILPVCVQAFKEKYLIDGISPRMIGVYLDNSIRAIRESNPEADTEVIRRELAPLLATTNDRMSQEILDTILSYRDIDKSLRMQDAPVTNRQLEYYGKPYRFDSSMLTIPEGDLLASEIEIGVLALYGTDGTIVGCADCRSHLFESERPSHDIEIELFPPEELMSRVYGYDLPGYNQDARTFLEELRYFYSDRTEDNSEIWSAIGSFTFTYPSTNSIGTEEKYNIWRRLSSRASGNTLEDEEAMTSLLRLNAGEAPYFATALEENPDFAELFSKSGHLGRILDRQYTSEAEPGDREVIGAVEYLSHNVAVTERYMQELAIALTPPADRTNEQEVRRRMDFLRPLERRILREAISGIGQADNRSWEIVDACGFHGAGIAAVSDAIRMVLHAYDPSEAYAEMPFYEEELPAIQAFFANYPQSEYTYNMLVARWHAQAMAHEVGTTVTDKQAALERFIDYFVADMSGYDEGAGAYTDTTGIDALRLAGGITTLVSEGAVPQDNPRILVIGPGSALRVEGPAFERLMENGTVNNPEIVLYDMMDANASRRWDNERASWVQGRLGFDDFPVQDFDAVVMWGSVDNNMLDYRMLLRYRQLIASVLKTGGVFMYETGSPVPLKDVNTRVRAMRKHHERHPGAVYGAIAPISDYEPFFEEDNLEGIEPSSDPRDKRDKVNAYLFEHASLLGIGRWAGLELRSPPADPIAFAELERAVQNPITLRQMTEHTLDCVAAPFMLVPDSEGNCRTTYTYTYTGQSHPFSDFFFAPFMTALAEERKGA